MNRAEFQKIESEDEFVALLKKHDLFREDDITFDDLGEDMYVYTGNDFRVDAALFEELEFSALLVVGNVVADFISVTDILGDSGAFCVTGNMRCKDLFYMTESTGMGVGGNLVIENIFYSDCGNSGLQVNGDLTAKLFFNFQCDIDVRGQETIEFDESATAEELASFGITVGEGQRPMAAAREYFRKYET
jgi:hypothetical protein